MKPGFQLTVQNKVSSFLLYLVSADDCEVIEKNEQLSNMNEESLSSASCHVALCVAIASWINHDDMISSIDSPNHTNRCYVMDRPASCERRM
jgi:hypothetical protein